MASSTKSFQLSGLSRGSHMTLCTSSVTYPWKRLSPCPRMKAFMSSLRLDRSSDIDVFRAAASPQWRLRKLSYSECEAGYTGQEEPPIRPRRPRISPSRAWLRADHASRRGDTSPLRRHAAQGSASPAQTAALAWCAVERLRPFSRSAGAPTSMRVVTVGGAMIWRSGSTKSAVT